MFLVNIMIDFSLYIQSSYSMNGSLIDFDKLVVTAKKLGYKTLGLADFNRMHGVIKFYSKCLSEGIKPIIGLEVVVKFDSSVEQNLILYAKDDIGYKNLIKISSYLLVNQETFLVEDIKKYADSLIAVELSNKSSLADFLFNNRLNEAKNLIKLIGKIFPENYVGLDLNDYAVETKIAPQLDELGEVVITNNVMYYSKEDKETSEILKKILRNNTSDEGLFEGQESYAYLRELSELNAEYSPYLKAVNNTKRLIEKCNVQIDFSKTYLPKFPMKKGTAYERLTELSAKGVIRRLQQKNIYDKENYKKYKNRLNFELDIIKKMGYEDYFLIVWDFILYAKKQGILMGPGRGSSAGSLVAYALGIVDVDPIEFDLYFERFLNPERITMPDIDIDFPDEKRDKIIKYVYDKYGKENVVSIITFGTFQGKSAIRDVGRILGTDSTVIEELTKNISETDNSIENFRNEYPKKFKYFMNNPDINKLISMAEKLNGLCRHTSTHAAGIIITGESIIEHSPIQKGLLGMYQSQYEAVDLEKLGLLKFDFLGIRNLSMIADTIELIKETEGIDINIYKIPLDDKKTFKLLQDVRTYGIFQLESKGMMKLINQLQIKNFEEIATCISLYRPGPMDNIPTYLRRRNKEEAVEYLDPVLKPILKSTNGIIIYQEQIMKIANVIAGYSLGGADVLRRAVSKKKKSTLVYERERFVTGAKNQGYSETLANEVYDYIVKFANYGFNKSHAVAYALVSYWMAYLKANHPANFLSILLNSQIGSVGGTRKYKMECQNLGIKILPPRINFSGVKYRFEEGNLRYPYRGIRNVGPMAAQSIMNIQEEKPISSFIDFMARASDININVIESLIYVGVFDDFGINRKTLIENVSRISDFVKFDYQGAKFNYINHDEYDFGFLQNKEKELLGVNIEYHLIYKYNREIKEKNLKMVSDIIEESSGKTNFVGVLQHVKVITTKQNREMAFIEIEDEFNSIEGVVFSNTYDMYKDQLLIGTAYYFSGQKELRNNQPQVIINSIKIME